MEYSFCTCDTLNVKSLAGVAASKSVPATVNVSPTIYPSPASTISVELYVAANLVVPNVASVPEADPVAGKSL